MSTWVDIICHVDVRLESGRTSFLPIRTVLMHWLGITQTNFESLWVFVIANVSTLLPLPFLSWLPAESATLQPVPAIDTDATASKQIGQTFFT